MIKKHCNELNIFTTNYDLAIEEYCSNNSIYCIDGFKVDDFKHRFLWKAENYDNITYDKDSSQRIYLYKLHGSLNWKRHLSQLQDCCCRLFVW
jgi:hypothetical protein